MIVPRVKAPFRGDKRPSLSLNANSSDVGQKCNPVYNVFLEELSLGCFISPPFVFSKGLCGLWWHIRLKKLPSRTCHKGIEGVRMHFLTCLMSHNKERSAWKALCCEMAKQHSYKLRKPCQLLALLTFPSAFLCPFLCHSKKKTSCLRK